MLRRSLLAQAWRKVEFCGENGYQGVQKIRMRRSGGGAQGKEDIGMREEDGARERKRGVVNEGFYQEES